MTLDALVPHERAVLEIGQGRCGMDSLSVLQALCEGNPPVAAGFPLHKVGNAELWTSAAYDMCRINGSLLSTMSGVN